MENTNSKAQGKAETAMWDNAQSKGLKVKTNIKAGPTPCGTCAPRGGSW